MRALYARLVLAGFLASASVVVGAESASSVGTTTRVSVDSAGNQANAASTFSAISGDGRYVAFVSDASNLVADDHNFRQDVFVRDRQTATTERVSVSSSEVEANGSNFSFPVGISDDGRYVAFNSKASNLVAGDTNGVADVFVRDRQAGMTERISLDSAEAQGNGASISPSISADGRYVVFESLANNLVSGDTNGLSDIFVRDRTAGTTERVTPNISSGSGPRSADISDDGRYVAYACCFSTPDLDVFLYDRQLASTTTVAAGNGVSTNPRLSADGRFIAFQSTVNNLVPGDTNGANDAFVWDRQASIMTLISRSTSGGFGNYGSFWPTISADGRFIAFASSATNLVADDYNIGEDVFVYDRQGDTMTRVLATSSNAPFGGDRNPAISADGTMVSFQSDGQCVGGGDTNGVEDVFVHDVSVPGAGGDEDCDGVSGAADNCPVRANGSQQDADEDGPGDKCDNCPFTANPGQENSYGEPQFGDACDGNLGVQHNVDILAVDIEDDAAPANAATSVGSVEACRRITKNNVLDADEDAVDSLFVDLVAHGAEGVSPPAGLSAFSTTFEYDGNRLRLNAVNPSLFLAANGGSTVVDWSDPVPDSDGAFTVAAHDTGAGAPESGEALLARISVEATSAGPSLSRFASPLYQAFEYGFMNGDGHMVAVTTLQLAPVPTVAVDASCGDADHDNDTIPSFADNCTSTQNADQANNDGDSQGDACDTDDDNDGSSDAVEPNCGSNPMSAASRPERVDGPFTGVDDDGDGQVDEGLPADVGDVDCDGDGYKGPAENNVFSYLPQTNGDQKTCQEYDMSFSNPTHKPSKRWPADLNGSPFSFNKINVSDIAAFVNPIRYLNQDVGTDPMDIRFDLVPGSSVGFDINIADMAAITSGASAFPPMLGGAKAFNGPVCPYAP